MFGLLVRLTTVAVVVLNLLACIRCQTQNSCTGALSQAEYDALYAIYVSANGPDWDWDKINSTIWKFPVPLTVPCTDTWQGVFCLPVSSQPGMCEIEMIDLRFRNLQGYIPKQFGNLTKVATLYLNSNSLTGTIPTELGFMTTVTTFTLNDNLLTGPIPSELSSLLEMNDFDLSNNNLEGTIPIELLDGIDGFGKKMVAFEVFANYLSGTLSTSFGTLTGLEFLDLEVNSFSGTIPTEIGKMESMTSINMGTNLFSGTIPTELGNLRLMSLLYVNNNLLSSTVPLEVVNLPLMQELYTYSNFLTGTIYSEIGSANKLQQLYANNNFFYGTIPIDLFNSTSLQQLYYYYNFISGTIPSQIGSVTTLTQFLFESNLLKGKLPKELGSLANLQQLSFITNSISGSIPTEFGSLTSLQQLLLANCLLTGTLPTELGLIKTLQTLQLSVNFLIGTLPTEFGNLQSLALLYLDSNQLVGTIPTQFGQLGNLSLLGLNENLLTGTLPIEIGQLPSIIFANISLNSFGGNLQHFFDYSNYSIAVDLDFSMNAFTGPIPKQLFANSYSTLQTAILFSNCFSGTLPSEICSTNKMQTLILDGLSSSPSCSSSIDSNVIRSIFRGFFPKKFMKGTIPDCIWSMPNLTTLHLSSNGFTGPISVSDSMAISPTLTDINLRGNLLSGTIPDAILLKTNFVQLDVSRNRLSGILPVDLQFNPNITTYVDFSVNRLSGIVPNSLANFPMNSVNINNNSSSSATIEYETGNLFQCSSASSASSSSNSDDNNEICGSYDLNVAVVIWVITVSLVSCFCFLLWFSATNKTTTKKDSNEKLAPNSISTPIYSAKSSSDNSNNINRIHSHASSASNASSNFDPTALEKSGSLVIANNSQSPTALMVSDDSILHSSLIQQQTKQQQQKESIESGNTLSSFNAHTNSNYHQSISQNNSRNNSQINGYKTNSNHIINYFTIWYTKTIEIQQENIITQTQPQPKRSQLTVFLTRLNQFLSLFFMLTAIYVTVVLVTYVLLKLEYQPGVQSPYSTHTRQYGWLITAAYLHSYLPPILVMLYLMFSHRLIVDYVCSSTDIEFSNETVTVSSINISNDTTDTVQTESNNCDIRSNQSSDRSNSTVTITSSNSNHKQQPIASVTRHFNKSNNPINQSKAVLKNENETENENKSNENAFTTKYFYPFVLQLINITIILVVNGFYVYLVLDNITPTQLFFLQICLSLFKLTWKSTFVNWAMKILQTISNFSMSTIIPHQTTMLLVNFIAGPILATLFTDSTCLYYAVEGQSSVTSNYIVDSIQVEDCVIAVYNRGPTSGTTGTNTAFTKCSYSFESASQTSVLTPPWIYSYQCSSALLSNYIPVLFYAYTFSGIIFPIIQFFFLCIVKTIAINKENKTIEKREINNRNTFTSNSTTQFGWLVDWVIKKLLLIAPMYLNDLIVISEQIAMKTNNNLSVEIDERSESDAESDSNNNNINDVMRSYNPPNQNVLNPIIEGPEQQQQNNNNNNNNNNLKKLQQKKDEKTDSIDSYSELLARPSYSIDVDPTYSPSHVKIDTKTNDYNNKIETTESIETGIAIAYNKDYQQRNTNPYFSTSERRLFQVNNLISRLLLDLAVMLTFGLASPILSVAIFVSVCSFIWKYRVLIGQYVTIISYFGEQRLRHDNNDDDNDTALTIQLLEQSIKNCFTNNNVFSMLIVIVSSAIFWSVLIFDMLSDSFGDIVGGTCATIFVVIVPIVFWIHLKRRKNLLFSVLCCVNTTQSTQQKLLRESDFGNERGIQLSVDSVTTTVRSSAIFGRNSVVDNTNTNRASEIEFPVIDRSSDVSRPSGTYNSKF